MKKQKICIIGGSLTGLVTAICLSKLNCEIDLISSNFDQNLKFNGTIAISQSNLDFLNQLNISQSFEKEVWPCSVMKLYGEDNNKKFLKTFELNRENKNEKILYMLENSKIMKLMVKKAKQIKSISIKNKEKISSISSSAALRTIKFKNSFNKYNLIIICTGHNSNLVKNIFKEKVVENSYKELAITTTLSHSPLRNYIVRQIFLENEIFALLPISNTKTSIVWTLKKNISGKNESFLKKKIKFYSKNYIKNINFLEKIKYKDLNFLIRNKYYKDRILLFGDALHLMHPFVGQGFNMTLRDLKSLQDILTKKINLGLDIGSSDILSEFSDEVKPRNFAFSLGTDLLKNSISSIKLRKDALKILDKSNLAKNIFFDIANKGLRF